ncbi:MAG: hypothetical protein ABL879_10415 [Devosia sp.]
MGLARYFVFNRSNKWVVALEGVAMARHGSKPEALSSAIVMADLMGAMKHEADVMVEDEGRLELAWTYGRDAMPDILADRRSPPANGTALQAV